VIKWLYPLFIFSLFVQNVHAEFSYIGRSAEGSLMGDAYTAVADDENTLFYNPAALSRHSGVSLQFVNVNFELPDVLDKNVKKMKFGLDGKFENFPKTAEGITERVLGIPVFFQVGGTPTVKMQHFAFSLFANNKTSMVLENYTYPNLNIDYRFDRGFIMGYSHNLSGNYKSSSQLSIGASIKHVKRNGLKGRFDLFGTELLDIINNSSGYKEIRRSLGYTEGDGWGFDIGAEQVFRGASSVSVIGLSILDVGDTRFKKANSSLREVQKQDMSVNLGASFSKNYHIFDTTFAVDYSNAIDPRADFASKLKLGARLRLPMLSVYTGWNGGYVSYGVGLDFWLMHLKVGFYGVEAGSSFKEKESERIVFALTLLDLHFDL
tara:strand:+ start:1002 stop:2135 length:1134 start_codon:yes stop_codon:yes gene_type:complete